MDNELALDIIRGLNTQTHRHGVAQQCACGQWMDTRRPNAKCTRCQEAAARAKRDAQAHEG